MTVNKPISAKFPFESKYVEVEGSRIHYFQEDNPHLIGKELARWYGG
ncbi:MAG: hypothetical protein RRA15_08745 [bacterium]|nr:hypothetical protein [bacterium]MDT8366569.1 hypothetical protein [bacterium]